MIPAGLTPPHQNACASAPNVTGVALTDSLDTCAGGGGWSLDVEVTYSGSFGGGFELELWRKAWEDADPEPGSYSFWSRKTAVGASPVTYTNEDAEGLVGSDDQGSGSKIIRRKFMARVVPASSANGSGPFCDDQESLQLDSSTAYFCTI